MFAAVRTRTIVSALARSHRTSLVSASYRAMSRRSSPSCSTVWVSDTASSTLTREIPCSAHVASALGKLREQLCSNDDNEGVSRCSGNLDRPLGVTPRHSLVAGFERDASKVHGHTALADAEAGSPGQGQARPHRTAARHRQIRRPGWPTSGPGAPGGPRPPHELQESARPWVILAGALPVSRRSTHRRHPALAPRGPAPPGTSS